MIKQMPMIEVYMKWVMMTLFISLPLYVNNLAYDARYIKTIRKQSVNLFTIFVSCLEVQEVYHDSHKFSQVVETLL